MTQGTRFDLIHAYLHHHLFLFSFSKENLIKFDEKISFIKEKYSFLEARLNQLKQGLKNTNSDKLAEDFLNKQGQASWRNIETPIFIKNFVISLSRHQKRRGKDNEKDARMVGRVT